MIPNAYLGVSQLTQCFCPSPPVLGVKTRASLTKSPDSSTGLHAVQSTATVSVTNESIDGQNLPLADQLLRDFRKLTGGDKLRPVLGRSSYIPMTIIPRDMDVDGFIKFLNDQGISSIKVDNMLSIKDPCKRPNITSEINSDPLQILILDTSDLKGNLNDQAAGLRHYSSNRVPFLVLVKDPRHMKELWDPRTGNAAVGINGSFQLIDASSGHSKIIGRGEEYDYLDI